MPVQPTNDYIVYGDLTHVVAVRRLRGSILKAGQDLPLPHIAVSHQEKLEQKIVCLDGTGSVVHPQRRVSPCSIVEPRSENLDAVIQLQWRVILMSEKKIGPIGQSNQILYNRCEPHTEGF